MLHADTASQHRDIQATNTTVDQETQTASDWETTIIATQTNQQSMIDQGTQSDSDWETYSVSTTTQTKAATDLPDPNNRWRPIKYIQTKPRIIYREILYISKDHCNRQK